MDKYKERLWMPYQVGLELFNNRRIVISGVKKSYGELKNKLQSEKKDFFNFFDSHFSKHPTLMRDDIEKIYDKSFDIFNKFIDKEGAKIPDYESDDIILKRLLSLFEGKLGNDFDKNALDKIYAEGEKRYMDNIPPGYKDKDKSHNGKRHLYGDLIIWKELMSYSKNEDKDIILISDDLKEDWWERNGGKVENPRVELIREFRQVTGHVIGIYQQKSFIKKFEKRPKKATISEIERINEMSSTEMSQIVKQAIKYRKRSLFPDYSSPIYGSNRPGIGSSLWGGVNSYGSEYPFDYTQLENVSSSLKDSFLGESKDNSFTKIKDIDFHNEFEKLLNKDMEK